MKVHSIHFDDTETPDEITVTMTLEQAVLIADHVGSLTPTTEASGAIWDALNRSMFCAFWDDGLDDAKRGKPATR